MKKIFFPLAILLVLCSFTYHQLINESSVSIEVVNCKVLYKGMDNPLVISATNVSDEDLIVLFNGEEIAPKEGVYHVSPKSGLSSTIEIYQKDNDGSKTIIRTEKYANVSTPSPTLQILGKTNSGFISKKELAVLNNLEVNFDTYVELGWEIDSYKFSALLQAHEGVVIQLNEEGATLSQKMKDLLAEVEVGDRIYFENVMAHNERGVELQLGYMSFTVK